MSPLKESWPCTPREHPSASRKACFALWKCLLIYIIRCRKSSVRPTIAGQTDAGNNRSLRLQHGGRAPRGIEVDGAKLQRHAFATDRDRAEAHRGGENQRRTSDKRQAEKLTKHAVVGPRGRRTQVACVRSMVGTVHAYRRFALRRGVSVDRRQRHHRQKYRQQQPCRYASEPVLSSSHSMIIL
ncbi:MAG: hypothetical protein IJV27_02360 [Prevotella sp.]|nr:hypothetical protein [Prevotella sp.]